MRNAIDFSSWQGVVSTLLGLVVFSLVAVGIWLLLMHSVQQRRERENRQINERLKTLIAAYKTLGGSFTGNLSVDPSHRRDFLQRRPQAEPAAPDRASIEIGAPPPQDDDSPPPVEAPGADRRRRIRDAVEAALSDVILLGTEAQVRLAARAAADMMAGRAVETAALVVSLREFIREVLGLDPIPAALAIPKQGPVRASGSGGGARAGRNAGPGGGSRGGAVGGGGGRVGDAAGGGIEGPVPTALPRGALHDEAPGPARAGPARDSLSTPPANAADGSPPRH